MNRVDERRRRWRRRTLLSPSGRKSLELYNNNNNNNNNNSMTNIPGETLLTTKGLTVTNVESTIDDLIEKQKKRIQQMNNELSQKERKLYENRGVLGFISTEEEMM